MSKLENLGNNKDIFSIWKNNISSFYSNVEKAIPEFHQVSTDLVQEYLKSWNNFATSAIDLQREIATKT